MFISKFANNLNFCFYLYHVKFNFLFNFEYNLYFLAVLSFCFYIFSISGLLFNMKNILISLFFVELTYFSIIIFLLLITLFFQNFEGFIYSLIILLLAAAESAVGLGLVILIFSYEKRITFDYLIELQ